MNNPDSHFEHHLTIDDDQSPLPCDDTNLNAVERLKQTTELSKQQIKQAMHKGAVWLTRGKNTRRLRRAKKPLLTGDTLHVYYDENILNTTPSAATLIKDEGAYSVWYKPYGMYCQGSKWGDHCTINRWIEHNMNRPAFIVHRLDRATTGLILIAHEKKVTAALADLFKQRKLEKHYRAIVHGCFPDSQIPKTLDGHIDGRTAISHVTPVSYSKPDNQSIVEVKIDSGRKHQIRRHLSEFGFPIVGDRLYSTQNDSVDLKLCSCYLAFVCPVQNKEIHVNLLETDLINTSEFKSFSK